MQKRVGAVALADEIGRKFRGVVTGASEKGTYVRVFDPPVEGRVIQGREGAGRGGHRRCEAAAYESADGFYRFCPSLVHRM